MRTKNRRIVGRWKSENVFTPFRLHPSHLRMFRIQSFDEHSEDTMFLARHAVRFPEDQLFLEDMADMYDTWRMDMFHLYTIGDIECAEWCAREYATLRATIHSLRNM